LAGFYSKCLLLSFKKFSAVSGTIIIISIFTDQRVFQDLLHFKLTVLVQRMFSFDIKKGQERLRSRDLANKREKAEKTAENDILLVFILFYDNCK
jgi:hypothetical protein